LSKKVMVNMKVRCEAMCMPLNVIACL
jgi:hypothetical protein